MNLIKNIFARFWALWGLISFVLTFLIIFLPSMAAYLFKNYKKGQAYFISLSRVWMRIWLILIACPFKIKGKENFINGENYIVTFNHNALLDVPLSAPFVPGASKTIAKASFAKVPIFGFFYRRGGVMVDRKSEMSRIKSFDAMKKVLTDGMHMSIYPEGTRNKTAAPLKPFYDGAFKLAVESKKEIIPCIIFGTKEAMPINKFFYLLPTKLHMHFLPAVSSINKDTKSLKDEVFTIMETHYVKGLST